ncbi:MAG: hypothetical protein ABJH06_00555, partial [Paraglaciecola sp.]|uniref:hypothetical protein n=1 Tax=Paraglaciecola sp. TaxID=1920173 RepID=UPI0032980122
IYQTQQLLLDVVDDFKVIEKANRLELVNYKHKFTINTYELSLLIHSVNETPTHPILELSNINLKDNKLVSIGYKVTSTDFEKLLNLNDGSTSSIRIKICGYYGSPSLKNCVNFEFNLTFFKHTSYVKLEYVLHNPKAALHPNGRWDLGDPNSYHFESLALKFKNFETPTTNYQTELMSTWHTTDKKVVKIEQFTSGGENWDSPVHLNSSNKIPHSICGYHTTENGQISHHGQRATPKIQVGQQFTITLERFWQNFPKAIELSADTIEVSIFPKQEGRLHELQAGEKKSHILWVSLEDRSDNLEWVHHTRQVNVPLSWLQSAKVLYPLASFHENEILSKLIKTAVDGDNSFFIKREILDEYGWRNFGDIYADHETAGYEGKHIFVSHYNNQYDPLMGFIKQFLATGNAKWFELADDLAKHIKDIDIYNTQEDKNEYNGGLFWHTDHYLEAHTSSHRSYSKHQASNAYQDHAGGGGPGGQHCYTTGLMLHYFLTANESSKTVVLTLTEWITNVYEGSGTILELLLAFRNRHLAGSKNHFTGQYPLDRGTANYLVALLDSYELTQDQTFLTKVEDIISHTVHPTESVGQRSLDDVENTWFYTVLLQAMSRYLHIKLNQGQLDESFYYCRDSLLNYAQWMLEHEYPYLEKPEILEYPNDTWTAQDLRKAHILASAYYFSHDKNEEYLKKAKYFEDYVANRLNDSETKTYTRILVLTMQNYGAVAFYQNAKEIDFDSLKENWPKASYQKLSLVTTVIKIIFKRLLRLSIKREFEWLKIRLS